MALQEMSTVIKYDQEKLDVDGLPEYIRDTDSPARDAFGSISTRSLAEREAKRLSAVSERQSQKDTGGFANIFSDVQTPPADELEALWPGVHQDFFQSHAPKRTPSFHMMVGFLAGAVVSMVCIWGYSAISGLIASGSHNANKAAVTAPATTTATAQSAPSSVPQGVDPSAVLKPAHPTVEVQNGDTMAAIALREYGKATPRLLDAICKANGMRNANFLNLGQKLNLPDYLPQAAQTAAGQTSPVQ